MTGYRVTFFKNLVNSSGHCVKCPQATISVEHAKSIERALTAGKRRFERTKGIQDWTLHADLAELEAIDAIGHHELLLTSSLADNDARSSRGPCEKLGRH